MTIKCLANIKGQSCVLCHSHRILETRLVNMDVDFSGKWTLESSDNYEAYINAFDIDDELKQQMLGAKPTIVISQTAEEITLTYEAISYSHSIHPGKENEYTLPNGTKIKGTPTWEGKTLVTRITGEKGRTHMTMREIIGGKLVQTMEIDAIKTVRTFQKV